jgi:hypothetical protein
MPGQPGPVAWTIYRFADKLRWVGVVVAVSESDAIEKAVAEFNISANRLVAKRGW